MATFPPASRSPIMPEPTTAASNSAVPTNSPALERRSAALSRGRSRRLSTDRIKTTLQGQAVKRAERQAREQLDAVLKRRKCLTERAAPLQLRAVHGSRVRQAPMSRHGMARPRGTRLAGGAVTDGEDEVHGWCAGDGKFIPGFRPQSFRRQVHLAQQLQRQRMDFALRMTARAMADKAAAADAVDDRLAKNAAGGVAGAQEQDVEGSHAWHHPQQALAGAAGCWSDAGPQHAPACLNCSRRAPVP